MLPLLIEYLLAFLAGLAVKITDWLEDERKSNHPIKYVFAILYGVLLGYTISVATFSVLFLAALIAQVFAGKVDKNSHLLGYVVAAVCLFAFGFPAIDIALFGYFLIFAFLDEIEYVGKFEFISTYRPLLPLSAVPFILFGRIDFLIGILIFDIGYFASEPLANSFVAKKDKKNKVK
ncbi:hypothetical protein HY988_07580 [Candidatus Micrarchaeota archaeon]|nr:hypothetical protein [Candidatus Micrarchaeota archaeon]